MIGLMIGPDVCKPPVTNPPFTDGFGTLRAWKACNLAWISAGRLPPPAKADFEANGIFGGGRLAALVGPRGFVLCPEPVGGSENERREDRVRVCVDCGTGVGIEASPKGSGDEGELGSSEGVDAIAPEGRTGDEK
jgi:hypothetical protein